MTENIRGFQGPRGERGLPQRNGRRQEAAFGDRVVDSLTPGCSVDICTYAVCDNFIQLDAHTKRCTYNFLVRKFGKQVLEMPKDFFQQNELQLPWLRSYAAWLCLGSNFTFFLLLSVPLTVTGIQGILSY